MSHDEPATAGGAARVPPEGIEGRAVYANDGRYLGRGDVLDGAWFKVDAPQAQDYWLPMSSIRAVVHGQVLLHEDTATVRKIRRYETPQAAEERFEREDMWIEEEMGMDDAGVGPGDEDVDDVMSR